MFKLAYIWTNAWNHWNTLQQQQSNDTSGQSNACESLLQALESLDNHCILSLAATIQRVYRKLESPFSERYYIYLFEILAGYKNLTQIFKKNTLKVTCLWIYALESHFVQLKFLSIALWTISPNVTSFWLFRWFLFWALQTQDQMDQIYVKFNHLIFEFISTKWRNIMQLRL